MSKNGHIEETNVQTANTIEAIMQEKGAPTLKAIATVFELPPARLYTVAKQPKEGVAYDPKVYNWDAIERFITRRLGQEGKPATIEEVIEKALELDKEFKEKDGRKAANRGVSGGVQQIEVDGKMIAARKYVHHEMVDAEGNPTNTLIVLRQDPNVYKPVYQTPSHTVLVPVSDREGTIASQMVKVISNGMLNHKGFAAASNEQGIEMRFSGEYLEKFPQYAPGYKEPEEAPTTE